MAFLLFFFVLHVTSYNDNSINSAAVTPEVASIEVTIESGRNHSLLSMGHQSAVTVTSENFAGAPKAADFVG